MLSRQQNYLNTDTSDKQIFYVADLDTDTGIIKGLVNPQHVYNLEDLRQDLIAQVRARKDELPDGTSTDDGIEG